MFNLPVLICLVVNLISESFLFCAATSLQDQLEAKPQDQLEGKPHVQLQGKPQEMQGTFYYMCEIMDSNIVSFILLFILASLYLLLFTIKNSFYMHAFHQCELHISVTDIKMADPVPIKKARKESLPQKPSVRPRYAPL